MHNYKILTETTKFLICLEVNILNYFARDQEKIQSISWWNSLQTPWYTLPTSRSSRTRNTLQNSLRLVSLLKQNKEFKIVNAIPKHHNTSNTATTTTTTTTIIIIVVVVVFIVIIIIIILTFLAYWSLLATLIFENLKTKKDWYFLLSPLGLCYLKSTSAVT